MTNNHILLLNLFFQKQKLSRLQLAKIDHKKRQRASNKKPPQLKNLKTTGNDSNSIHQHLEQTGWSHCVEYG